MSADGAKVVIIPSTPYIIYGTRAQVQGGLHGGKVHPRDAAIEVEGIDVGHPRDIVQRTLDTAVHRRTLHLILATYTAQQRAAILVVGVKLRLQELV